MGDLPEPRYGTTANGPHKVLYIILHSRNAVSSFLQDTTPVMTKLYSTLSRNFSKKDLEAAQQAADFESSVKSVGSVCLITILLIMLFILFLAWIAKNQERFCSPEAHFDDFEEKIEIDRFLY